MKQWLPIAVFALGCSKGPSAMDVCKQIEATGVGSNCRADTPGGLGMAAKESALFDLPSVPERTGQVLKFDDDDKLAKTIVAFQAMAMLAGPHRYGSKKARVFVQMNNQVSVEDGAKVRGVVEALGDLVAPASEPTKTIAQQLAKPEPESAPEPSAAKPEEQSAALVACKKLEAVGAVTVCAAKKTQGGASIAIFRSGTGGGTMSVHDDVSQEVFNGLAANLAKQKGRKVATKNRFIASWEQTDADTDKKLRAAIDTL
jgi:hypothetical protein